MKQFLAVAMAMGALATVGVPLASADDWCSHDPPVVVHLPDGHISARQFGEFQLHCLRASGPK